MFQITIFFFGGQLKDIYRVFIITCLYSGHLSDPILVPCMPKGYVYLLGSSLFSMLIIIGLLCVLFLLVCDCLLIFTCTYAALHIYVSGHAY